MALTGRSAFRLERGKQLTDRRSAYIAWVVVCIVWGMTYLGIRLTLETVPPFLMASFRWLAAGAILLIALSVRGESIPKPRAWPSLAVLGILMMGFGNGGVVWAQQTVPSGLTAVLVAGIPFWMVGLDALMHGAELLTVRRLAGLAVGFAGIILLVWPEVRLGEGRSFVLGVAATQVACMGWAIGSNLSKRRDDDENVLAAAAVQMVFAGLALLAVGTLRDEWRQLFFNGRTGWALAYLIVAGSVVGYSAYAYALKHLPIATVSLYAYVNPVIAVALGSMLLGEPFNSRMLIAAAVIFLGSAMVKAL